MSLPVRSPEALPGDGRNLLRFPGSVQDVAFARRPQTPAPTPPVEIDRGVMAWTSGAAALLVIVAILVSAAFARRELNARTSGGGEPARTEAAAGGAEPANLLSIE